MATPASRQELIDYALRKLGAPVLEINVDEDQIEDRVDEALQKYRDFHMDGQRRVYLPVQVTPTDLTNKYVTLTDNVIYVTRVLPVTNAWSAVNMFSMKYQMYLNDFYALYKAESLEYYTQMQQYLTEVDQLLNGVQAVQYQRHGNKLYVDMAWSDKLTAGQYIIVECYVSLDDTPEMWNDSWLKRYTTALIKQQWGQNLSKFDGMQLPGGVTINATKTLEDANTEIEALEQSLRDSYELPADFIVG
jgi:hypothetical protein